jgi:inosine-uridine nucleoside N-ribohydrolase
MGSKVIFIADPGIDGAFALALAMMDKKLEVLGIAATAGNIDFERATDNIHIIVNQLDPPRWPRLGAAPDINYDIDGKNLHGANGLGNIDFPCARLHNLPTSEKLIMDLVRQYPHEISVVSMGPLTVLARAFDYYPELPTLMKRVICLGGSLHEAGNAGPVSEFHMACDPLAARHVFRSGAPLTLIPLDVMRRVLFSPRDLLDVPDDANATCRFLRQIIPFGIAATSNLYGIEGFHLKDVLGAVAVARPDLIQTRSIHVDVETRGELTRGMTVFDQRSWVQSMPNVELAHHVDSQGVRDYMFKTLGLR